MIKYISVIEGDGIGPEIIKQTIKILNAIGLKYNHQFFYTKVLAGGSAIEKFGDPMPKESINSCYKSDAILFGCVGDPKYDNNDLGNRPEDGLLKLRKKMDLYCNIRPIKSYPEIDNDAYHINNQKLFSNVDFVIYRELTGGIYYGKKGRYNNGESAYDYCSYSKREIERIGHLAFQSALSRKKKLTLVDKSNVLETSRLWREIIKKMWCTYSEVNLDFLYVDNAAMQIIVNPKRFDVILTENMFGDILSDESSIISSSLGLLPSASIGEKISLFEPVHGSYPQAKGKNIANPLGCILSGSMMLEYFGMVQETKLLEKAVRISIKDGFSTKDINPNSYKNTDEVGDYIKKLILSS
ncbi:3-isopropylmalate dehydrogenase [Blattabacterium cuenoti]|uniref:3-isopropylmalate dehydrogenase n=1 Tax=Blattabacterium cuenoti TaxID=1653831 RepID=UPI00163C3324|nr:3-isopropylmalate dehydrogenase [Blattabacterium cuenoti]